MDMKNKVLCFTDNQSTDDEQNTVRPT